MVTPILTSLGMFPATPAPPRKKPRPPRRNPEAMMAQHSSKVNGFTVAATAELEEDCTITPLVVLFATDSNTETL